jgi:hypothetical protein
MRGSEQGFEVEFADAVRKGRRVRNGGKSECGCGFVAEVER